MIDFVDILLFVLFVVVVWVEVEVVCGFVWGMLLMLV